MTKSTLTPAQAAAVLMTSASTLRRWSSDYADQLSEDARGDGKRKRTYTPDDIDTLRRAADLLRAGHSPEDTRKLLALADETQQTAALATLPTIAHELQAARDLIVQLTDRVEALEGLRATDRAELDRLRSEVGALFERQRKAREKQEADLADLRAQLTDLQARRSWWQRLTRR